MKRDWKIKFSILMIIAAIIIFGTNYLVLKDTHSIVSYVWLHIGFIPIDIIIVAFILEDIMSRKEKEAIYEKLDMLISTFFTEIGNELIEEFSSANEFKASTSYLKAIPNWDDAEYDKQLKKLKNANIDFNVDIEGGKRAEFLINLGVRKKENIFTQGKGSSEPVASNLTEDGRKKNRRVEITIMDK